MKNPLILNPCLIFVLFICTSFSVIAQDLTLQPTRTKPSRDPATWQWSIPTPRPHVTHGIVHSEAMARDVGYNIYLPPGYAEDTEKRYPVVYFLHGASGSEYSDAGLIHLVIPEIEKGTIGETIYVFVNGGHYSRYRDNPETYVMSETYIIHELIPAIDSRYRTIASQESRALFGFSMGGGGSTRLAMKYPDMFCAVAALAAGLDRAPGSENPTDDNAAPDVGSDNVYHWATENQEQIRNGIGLFFVIGNEDFLYERHPPFMAHLHSLNIDFNYRVIAGLNHSLGKITPLAGRDAVLFLDSQLRRSKD